VSGPKPSRNRPAAFLGVALVLLTGCASLPPPRQPLPPEAHRLIALLRHRWQEFADLRALAEITIQRDGRVQRLTGVLLLRAPVSVRFEALTPWGQPFLFLVGNAESVTLYQVADNRALVGPASAKATARWLGLALEPRELVGILAGHVLPLEDPYSAEIVPADGVGPSIKLTGATGTQQIWVDPETGVVRQIELTGEKTPARITYAGRGPTDPPASLTLAALDAPLVVSVRYREPQLGTGPSPDLFTLTLPEGVKIQRFR
jgi:outer membrane lipoprotein-sorting protein